MALATKNTPDSPRADPLYLSARDQRKYQQYNDVSARVCPLARTVLQLTDSGHQQQNEYSSHFILPRLSACDSADRALLTQHTLRTLGASLCPAPAARSILSALARMAHFRATF